MSVMRSLFVSAALCMGGTSIFAQNRDINRVWWQKLGVTIPTLSYHSVRYRPYNEQNFGLIVNYDITRDAWRKRNRAVTVFAGAYHNSLHSISPVGGVEFSKKWGRFGVAVPMGLVGYNERASDTWDRNGNRVFVAHSDGPMITYPWAAPRVMFDFVKNRAGLSLMGGYLPEYGGLVTAQIYGRLGPR